MKRFFLIITLAFTACLPKNTTKQNNNIVIATFHNAFDQEKLKQIEKALDIQLSLKTLEYNQDFIQQVKKIKPDIVIGPSYLNNTLHVNKLSQETLLEQDFSDKMIDSVKKLYQNISAAEYEPPTIPLFIEDIKVFANDNVLEEESMIDLKILFNDETKNIVIHNDPRLVAWIAMNIFENNIPPHLIANPDLKKLEQAIEKFAQTKSNKTFYSYADAIQNWDKIDIYIGPNWIQNFVQDSKQTLLINNYNLLTLNNMVKTKYAKDKTDALIKYFQIEYENLYFSKKYIPVTLKESKEQFFNIVDDKKIAMILSTESNYYYFIDHNTRLDNMINYIIKSFL